MSLKTVLLFTLATLLSPALATTNQFQRWYPEYRHIFQRVLRDDCSNEYAFYLAGHRNVTRFQNFDRWIGATKTSQLAFPPASCVLDHTSEWMKFNMASASVLLGLTPTILAALGPTIEETSTFFIIARRPLLGMCLAAAAPSVYPFRNVDNKKAIKILQSQHSRVRHFTRPYQYLVMILEVILTAGAIANIATNSYQLGVQTCCIFAPHLWYLPLLWTFLGLVVHIYGSLALWASIDCDTPYRTFLDWLKIQFTPIAEQKLLKVKPFKETLLSIALSWWVSFHIACHIIFGTITFSSLIFITVRDALAVIGRYMVSLLICRAILTYELGILRYQYMKESEKCERSEDSDQELQTLRSNSNHTGGLGVGA